MIYDASTFPLPHTIDADLCVIGSGAGGSTVAMTAAEAGLRVVVLESGGFVPPDQMTQREEEMLPRLLYANGSQTTTDRGVHIHQGRAVGGSTVHNINLCKRIPDAILAEWERERGMEYLPASAWSALYDEAEALIGVSVVPPERWNRHNRLLQQGCDELGWRGGGLAHNRSGCVGSGFCLVGCAYDAKNNAPRITVPRAVRAGAHLVSRCQAVRIEHRGGEVTGVSAVALDPRTRSPLGDVTINAPRVCVSASATGTPALLLRSKVPDPGGETGQRLRIHPALVAAGVFDEPVNAWRGIPQTYECTELFDVDAVHDPHRPSREPGKRTWIVPAFAHPVGLSTMMPGIGDAHRDSMLLYPNLAVLTGMVHDLTAGRVKPKGRLGVAIDYWPNAEDRLELMTGLAACARLLHAAGARRVLIPTDPPMQFERGQDFSDLPSLELTHGKLDITAVHPMGSVPMGDDPQVAAVDSRGRHHHLRGLWVGDGSLFPSSIGGPPQLSIYAMGLHVGRAIVSDAGA